MHTSRARFAVLGDCYEAQRARNFFVECGSVILHQEEFEATRSISFGMFFFSGTFMRPPPEEDSRHASEVVLVRTEQKPRKDPGIVRVRSSVQDLLSIGVPEVPHIFHGAKGIIACRLLDANELMSPSMLLRFHNALRETERLCTKRVRFEVAKKRYPRPESLAA